MVFFVGFFIYFFKYVAVFKIFTPFIMRCESNLKVDRKHCALAFSYGPPKMFYPSVAFESKCCLCGNVFDKKHGRILFVKSNEQLLRDAEIFNGETLPCEEGLPSRDRHIMLTKLPIMLFSSAPDFTLMLIIMLYHIQSRAQKTRTLFNLTFVIINVCYIAT